MACGSVPQAVPDFRRMIFTGVAMALTDQDRAYIHEVAVNAAGEVSKQIIEDMLKWHTEACPHGKSILASKWFILGACVCSGISGGGMVALLIKIFSG